MYVGGHKRKLSHYRNIVKETVYSPRLERWGLFGEEFWRIGVPSIPPLLLRLAFRQLNGELLKRRTSFRSSTASF